MSHSMIHPRTPCITFMVKIHLTPAFRISDIICKSFPSHLLVPIASSLWMTYASISHADIFAWCQITTLQQKQLCTQSTIHAIKLRIITISYSIHSLYHLINGCPTPAVDSAAASAICRPGKHHVAFHSIQPFFHPTSQIQVHALHDLRTTTFPTFAILAAKSSWWSTTPTRPKPVRSHRGSQNRRISETLPEVHVPMSVTGLTSSRHPNSILTSCKHLQHLRTDNAQMLQIHFSEKYFNNRQHVFA